MLEQFASVVGRPLPAALCELYHTANGQHAGHAPLFNVARDGSRCYFLPVAQAAALWQTLNSDAELVVWSPGLIPFATDHAFSVLCIDADSAAVILLWTGGPDWTLPRGWQTDRFEAYPSLHALRAESELLP